MKGIVFYSLFIIILISSGCATNNAFEDGRSLGKGVKEIKGVAGLGRIIIHEENLFFTDGFALYPYLSLSYGYGIREKIDVGVRLDLGSNLSFNTKYQFYGDKNSKIAVSTGFEVGSLVLSKFSIANIQLPLYGSYHFTDKWSVYANPRYIRQFSFNENDGENMHILAGNLGLMVGNKNKFGVDLAILNSSFSNEPIYDLITFSIGGKLRF